MNYFFKALPVEQKNFTDFIPINFGMEHTHPSHTFGPYIRDYYLIHFVFDGKGVFKNGKKEYQLEKGDAFLIRPDEVCVYTADKNFPWSYIWIGFRGKLSKDFDKSPDVFVFDEFIIEELKFILEEKSMVEEQLISVLFRLYCLLFKNKMTSDSVNRAIGYINAYYRNDIIISELADMLHLNRKYLSRIFKKKTGDTIQQYIMKKKMAEARNLLESGYSVKETAFLCGYSDAYSFSKAFKKIYNTAPKHYKSI